MGPSDSPGLNQVITELDKMGYLVNKVPGPLLMATSGGKNAKPKIMPLKSISLERIEAMEREAKQLAETMAQREKEEKEKEEKARKETRGLE